MPSAADQIHTRKSLPLTQQDIRAVARLRSSSMQRQALSSLTRTGLSQDSSEATYLHALLQAGIRAAQDEADAERYAALAEERFQTRDQRRMVARRRRPSWADDE
jgi:hypothetical protein